MDLLERYIYENSLSGERILEEVDEWTLYCMYLGYEPELRKAYSSPLDEDKSPSFSVYEATRNPTFDYLWKDSGARMQSGGIFKLIKLIYGYQSYYEVYNRIAVDFEIDVTKSEDERVKIIDKVRPISKPQTRIRIKARTFSKGGLEYWASFGVSEELLIWKQVQEVEFVWYNDEQVFPIRCRTLTFAYPEFCKKRNIWCYQIYSPFEQRQFKFRNDLKSNQVYGYNHLEYKSPLLVITKSNKDILCLKIFGIESISPRSETTLIKSKTVDYLKSKYDRIVIWYDNDAAGINSASKYALHSVIVPLDSGCKDFSDYIKVYGIEKSRELLLNLGLN